MNYFKLGINPSSKKWKGFLNPETKLYDISGSPISSIELANHKEKIIEPLYYKILTDGKIAPVNSIGTEFIVFDENTEGANELSCSEIQLVKITNTLNGHAYLLANIYKHANCVDWDASEYDPWPDSYTPESWEYQKGRFFTNPVLTRSKIPPNLNAFRLADWGGAFNIIISEKIKTKITSMKFDHSFLDFRALTVV